MKESTHSSTNIYTIMEVLGEGFSGVVYKAEKKDESGQMSTTVALKVLNSNELIDIWRREFQSLKQVRSHNCVQVFGFERVMEKPALSLEYVEGLSLQELTGYGAMSPELIIEVCSQTLRGLKDLWEQGLYHGDLSPANVLVSTSGVVKLLDFGLGNRTESKTLGTPQFIAPEALHGRGVARESDLYSFGRVIEYLCIGDTKNTEFKRVIFELTHKEAERREVPDWESHPSHKRLLSKFVTDIYRQKKFEQEPTKEFTVKSVVIPLRKHQPVLFRRLILSGVMAIILLLVGLSIWMQRVQPSVASLKVRSNSWYRLTINGEDFGYTPIDIDQISSGPLVIQWEGPAGSGQRVLTLVEGENKVIDDTFFRQQGE